MILPLITAPYVSRVLGAELIGIYSYTHSIAFYFLLFAQLGISVYGNRTVAYVRDNKEELNRTFTSIYLFQLAMAILSCSAYFVFICTFQKEHKLYAAFQFLYVVTSIFDINWFFFGIEKFKLTVTRNSVIKILSVICVLLFVKSKEDFILYIIILAGSVLLGQIVMWTQVFKYVRFCPIKIQDITVHIKPIAILFLPTIATSLYRVLDKIMLGSMSNMVQLGYFENSEKFISISMGVINALGMVMIPRMSNLISTGDADTAKEYINKSMEGIFIICSAITFGMFCIATPLAVVFYGKDFAACGSVIKILSITVLFNSWANVLRTQYLIPNKKDREYIISMFCGAFINIVVNLCLIRKFGAIGAAFGTIFAELFVALAHSYFVRKKLPIIKYLKKVVPYIILGSVMCVAVLYVVSYLPQSVLGLVCGIAIGVFSYGILLLSYLYLSKNQFYYLGKKIITNFFRLN